MDKNKSDRGKIKTGICDYLIAHGCRSDYLGFSVLCDLLRAALENYADFALNLKSIYLKVGHKHKTTRLAIERNLRTLIEKWHESDETKFNEVFDNKVPTNAVFLHILARKLRYLNCSVYDTLLMP